MASEHLYKESDFHFSFVFSPLRDLNVTLSPLFCCVGNTFYLVMPTEQGESVTDDIEDPPTPVATAFPQPPEEITPPQAQEEETPKPDQSEATQEEQKEEETGQSQSHVIKNVDEIFHTIEGLMSKLRQLKVSVET